MSIYQIDPLSDPRWDALLARHPRASVFHTRGWLQALQWTYGYQPLAFTTSGPNYDLENGFALCEIDSWITGRRLVSLPFSDYCDPLADSIESDNKLLEAAIEFARKNHCRYTEIRPCSTSLRPTGCAWRKSQQFYRHVLSLRATEGELYTRLHADCIRRKVRRAEKEHLGYIRGTGESHLQDFYQLLLQTRRRHGVPPAPLEWFRKLSQSMGDHLKIRLATKDGRPVAAVLTLNFRTTATYKYGCSDEKYHQLGGMPFLFWKMIQEARQEGMLSLDLGRSDVDNSGLLEFKSRLGASGTVITYWRSFAGKPKASTGARVPGGAGKLLFRMMPRPALIVSGKLLYKHAG